MTLAPAADVQSPPPRLPCERGARGSLGALERISGKSACPDVILLNQVNLSIDEFINMGRRIRRAAGELCRTPIVVMAERFGLDMEGLDVLVGESEYVTYPEDGQQLMNLLHRLCSD